MTLRAMVLWPCMTLTMAAQNANDAEKWARDFSERLVRLLYHTHHILANAMNLENID